MQKIAVVSDIHGNILALEKVVADIETRQVDCVFNLGDHISGPLYPKETLDFLRKQDWVQLLGNHDRQLISQNPQQHGLSDRYAFSCLNDADLDWLRALPTSTMVKNKFFLFHGTPCSDTRYLLETVGHGKAWLATQAEIAHRLDGAMAQIMLCGHSHIPRVVEVAQNILVVNPGSVGLQAYDDVKPAYHVMETGSPHARYAILAYKNSNWQAEMISVGYDHQQAAQQARKNGRPDWEYALQTGFMPQKKSGDEKRPTPSPAGRRAGGSGQRRARVACQIGLRKARPPGRQTRPYIIRAERGTIEIAPTMTADTYRADTQRADTQRADTQRADTQVCPYSRYTFSACFAHSAVKCIECFSPCSLWALW